MESEPMRRFACLGLSLSSALVAAAPVSAQADGADTWALSGGFDLIELRASKSEDRFFWDASFSYGNSTDQIMLVTEGGGALRGPIDEAQARLFYGRTFGNTTVLLGARKDFTPHPRDAHAAIGVQGTVGTRINWEGYAFLSDDGDLIGESQVIYQLPITREFYLEPRVSIGWSAQDVPQESVGSGLTELEASLRLRYRLTQKITLYTAVVHERLLGSTRSLARDEGGALNSTVGVIGFGFNL
jgi:copper resistance protein B